jgi:Conserved TM helix
MINNFLESIAPSMRQAPLPDLPVLLMQASTSTVSVEKLVGQLSNSVPNILGAIAMLLIGWIVAVIAAWLVGTLLAKTDIDNRVLRSVVGSNTLGGWTAEKLASTIVFWVVFLFGIIGFLNSLNLTAVSAPLQGMLGQILAFIPRLLVAGLLAGVAWLVATFVKKLIGTASQSFGIDRKLGATNEGMLPSKTIADLSFWLILFFFLLPILDTLGLSTSLAPVQALSNDILSAVPKIFKAVIIGVVSWFVAKIVRDIVTNVAAAAGSERLAAQIGLNRSMPNQTLAGIAGTLVYVIILVPGIISALQALNIPAISEPAILMLNQITMMLPRVLTAGALIGLSFFIGRFLAELVTTTLSALGFDNIIQVLGLSNLVNEAVPPRVDGVADASAPRTNKTPSQLAGIVVLIATMLTAAISATNILGIPALTGITESVLYIGSQIFIGLIVFAVGLFLANLAYRLINAAGTRQASILAQAARIIIIVLVGAMGLQRMGIAPDIVNLAFGLTLGALAIAAAIAFGLGGRDVAGEQLRQWLTNYKSDRR